MNHYQEKKSLKWEEEFDKLCAHEYDDCTAHGEGQYCCLDVEHKRYKQIKDFIRTVIQQAKEESHKAVEAALHRVDVLEQQAYEKGKEEQREEDCKTIENKTLELARMNYEEHKFAIDRILECATAIRNKTV